MKKLLVTEWYKLRPYKTFWILSGLYIILVPLVFSVFNRIGSDLPFDPTQIYHFPEVWHFLAYLGSYFNILPGVLIIILITNEFSFRTIRQNIIDGLGRDEAVYAKLLVVLGISFFATVYLLVTGGVFGLAFSTSQELSQFTGKLIALGTYFFQSLGYMSMAVLLAFIFQKSGLTIILFILYRLVIEPGLSAFMPESIRNFLPAKGISGMVTLPVKIDPPNQVALNDTVINSQFLIGLGYTFLFIILTLWINRKRNL